MREIYHYSLFVNCFTNVIVAIELVEPIFSKVFATDSNLELYAQVVNYCDNLGPEVEKFHWKVRATDKPYQMPSTRALRPRKNRDQRRSTAINDNNDLIQDYDEGYNAEENSRDGSTDNDDGEYLPGDHTTNDDDDDDDDDDNDGDESN